VKKEVVMTENKESDRQRKMGVGIALGAALGAAIGTALDNLALGIGIGIAIGAALGAALGGRKSDQDRCRSGYDALPNWTGKR
jgi:uncharacterized membrane protein